MEDSPDDRDPVAPLSDVEIRAYKLAAVARLAPGITHELNNPLAAIGGFAELLRTDPRLPDDLRDQAALLVDEAARTQRIIGTLLEFLRERPPERQPTSVRALLDAVLVLHGGRLRDGDIDVRVEIDPATPSLPIDRSRMELVLVSLVQEAADAIAANGAPGRLRIDAVPTATGARITIDHGEAGPAPRTPDVDRGRQVSTAIVADHGGTLVRSERASLVALPAEPGSPVAAGTSSPARAMPARRVLVLDDEPSIRMLLERWLDAAGYEPTIATTGAEAIGLAEGSAFDAVLCDYRMAGADGAAVFDAIVAVRPELEQRFVFMTGDVLNPELRAFVERRRVDVLAKPFDLDAVRRTLDAVIART